MLELRDLVEIHREYHQSPQGNSTLATKFTSPHPLKTKINLHYIGYKDLVRTSQRTHCVSIRETKSVEAV